MQSKPPAEELDREASSGRGSHEAPDSLDFLCPAISAGVRADSVQQGPKDSSMLLNLAPELLDVVLITYYETTGLTVRHLPTDPRIRGMPSLAIEQTCKLLRNHSLAIRNKYIPRQLTAKHRRFLRITTPILCQPLKFAWLRTHVTSLRAILDLNMAHDAIPWTQLMTGFPKLKDLELWVTESETHPPHNVHPYMPLDQEENQRRLARDVVEKDWNARRAIESIKRRVLLAEEAFYGVRGVHANWHGFASHKSLEDTLKLRVVLVTIATDYRGKHFYYVVYTFSYLARLLTVND